MSDTKVNPASELYAPKTRKRTLPAPVKSARGRPKASLGAKHEDKRVSILRTAAQLFSEHGYEATSLDMISEQLGMHKATLYHYIHSKEEVLYQCLVKSFEDLDQVVEKMTDRSVPVLSRLRQFAISLSHAQNNDFGRCLVLVGSRPLELMASDSIRKFQRRLDTTVRDLVTEGIASGQIRPCNPGLVSAMLFGMLNWVPQWFKAGGSLALEQVVDNFIDMLTQGIAAQGPGKAN